jgi:cytochrome c oxidase subunit IV
MGHLSYEEGKKVVFKGLILLGVITLIEVAIALVGKGYIIPDFYLPIWIMFPAMIGLSLYKAYFIVYEFMHMKYEVKSLALSVLLPTLLLVWAIIAFFNEAGAWHDSRANIAEKDKIEVSESIQPEGAPIRKMEEHSEH